MIHTYGPGALVDLPQMSVVIAGIDGWNLYCSKRIVEPRLQLAVQSVPGCGRVTEFYLPPWVEETSSPLDEWARVGVQVHPFPRWLRCTRCDLLSPVDRGRFKLEVPAFRPDRARYFHTLCRNGKPTAVPARFVIACTGGHLDDFPWEQYVHRGGACTEAAQLELKEAGIASRATDVRVICKTCNAQRLLHDAFGPESDKHLPRCRGRHPHLQRFDDGCPEPTRALLLGASNSWFAVSRSALTIPTERDALGQRVTEHWDQLKTIDTRDELQLLVKLLPGGAVDTGLRWLRNVDVDDAWRAIRRRRGEGDSADSNSDTDLLGPEWQAFTAGAPTGWNDLHAPEIEFEVRNVAIPKGFEADLDPPVAVDRLREVQALCGFTRIEGTDDAGSSGSRTAPISNDTPTWLPAAVIRGEGLLIRLPEDRVRRWEDEYASSERYAHLLEAHRAWRTRRGLDPDGSEPPPARFVLLHTLSHLVIHQMAIECGYSAASIRERLYCREPDDPAGRPMAGVLLYTGSPDSEGTLGGLVALAEPERLATILRDGLRRAELCSTDPMCADHRAGELGDELHNAACHACQFAPETSCEHGNRYLDRAAVVPILGHAQSAYFKQVP